MLQDDIFSRSEGDAWFQRNKAKLSKHDAFDWPFQLLSTLADKKDVHFILELGCSNGWRLNRLRDLFNAEFVGVDVSAEAIQDGNKRYPHLTLIRAALASLPLNREFDVVIVNFVLHWVDRQTLARSIAEIDRLVRNDGYLLIGDFLPDWQQRRIYHHRLDAELFTYKQDYPKLFESIGTYREIARVTFDHNETEYKIAFSDSSNRCVCSILRKSLTEFYHKYL